MANVQYRVKQKKLGKKCVLDLSFLDEGIYGELELKTDNGRLSEAQEDRMRAVQDAGGWAQVVYGLDEALAHLTQRGYLR